MWRAYRDKRIVHINVNIILAGLLSTLIAIYPVHFLSLIIPMDIFYIIGSFLVDGFIDFSLFTIFHAMNHSGNLKKGKALRIFTDDVIKIQKQRIAFTWIFFILAAGGHYLLVSSGLGGTRSYVISYISAILLTRIVHTIYGLRTGLFD